MKEVKRVVSTGFWNDDKVLDDFSPEDKYFMLYLLTNPYTTQLGVYHLPLKKSALELGYSSETVLTLIERFENKYNLIKFNKDTSEVAIKNYLRHSIVKGGKPVLDCLEKEEKSIKDKSLISYVCNYLSEYINVEELNVTVKDYINKYTNENDNDNDNENERIVDDSSTIRGEDSKDSIHKEVIEHLNRVCGTSYRLTTKKTISLINARIKEGFTLDDFKKVIEFKHSKWIGTDMQQYLRPETLFGTKFEGYLNESSQGSVNHKPKNSFHNMESKRKYDFAELEKEAIGGIK